MAKRRVVGRHPPNKVLKEEVDVTLQSLIVTFTKVLEGFMIGGLAGIWTWEDCSLYEF